jgi:hypothetical protein
MANNKNSGAPKARSALAQLHWNEPINKTNGPIVQHFPALDIRQ